MDKRFNVMGKSKGDTSLQTHLRVMKVVKYILQGYSKRSFLHDIINEKEDWNVQTRQLDEYIKLAREIIVNNFNENDLQLELDIATNRLEAIYVMNMKIQDFREARNVTMDRMKLLGLITDKTKTDITTNGQSLNATPTPEEAKEISESLENEC